MLRWNGEPIFEIKKASRGGGGFMDRTRAGFTDAALEAAQIRAFLDNGWAQFLAESVPCARLGAGVRNITGINPDVGGGG
jgi:hypothetical protein